MKFNPSFWSGSDFEIEFIPFSEAVSYGKLFVSEIDFSSTVDLYRWACRQTCLTSGFMKYDAGVIIPKNENLKMADVMTVGWRKGSDVGLEPRQIIARIKRVYEIVEEKFSEPTAFAYNHFLFCGQLGALPYDNHYFSIELLKSSIEVNEYRAENADGEVVKCSLVDHLFDTYETEHIMDVLLNFLGVMHMDREMMVKEHKKRKGGDNNIHMFISRPEGT